MDDITTLRDVFLLMVMLLGGFALVGLTCFHGVLQASTSNLQLLVTSRPSLTDCL